MDIQNEELRTVLGKLFEEKNRKNPSFTKRAFALSIGLQAQEYYSFVDGKRKFSSKKILKVLNHLNISEIDKVKIQKLGESGDLSFNVYRAKSETYKLSEKQLDIVKDWHHYAILTIMELDDFEITESNISKRLNIPIETVSSSIEILKELGVVSLINDKLTFNGNNLSTSKKTPSESLREHHKQYINKAVKAIDERELEERHISSIKFCASKEKIIKAGEMIDDFRNYLAEYLSSGKKDEVYTLNVQLFPLTVSDKLQDGH